MNRTLWMSAAIAFATTAALVAQTPSTTSRTDDKTITVTGCLQESSATTAGATASTTGAAGFVLANAMMGTASSTMATPPATAGTTGTTGTTPSSASSSSHMSYKLDGSDSDLKKHVGHKIEVTGTLDRASHPPSATSTTASASMSGDQKIKVSSVKMIAADCTSR